jgi:hypothetical protein
LHRRIPATTLVSAHANLPTLLVPFLSPIRLTLHPYYTALCYTPLYCPPGPIPPYLRTYLRTRASAYLRTRASGQWSNPVGARRLLAPPAAADLVRGRHIAAPMTCAPLHLFRVCVPTPRFLCMSASCSQVLTRDPANPSTDSSQ